MEGRKTKKQAIQQILLILREQPLSINEIADKVGISWETMKNYLEFLKELNIIEEFEQGNKRMFKSIKRIDVEMNENTLFNLPIKLHEEELCKSLFEFIRQRWHEKTGKYPGRTQMQKTVIEVADRAKLDIPRGWYLLGEMCVLQYNEMETYEIKEGYITRELKLTVDACIDEFKQFKNSDAIIQWQYEKKHKRLYLIKKRLNEALLNKIETPEQEKEIGALLYSLAINFPERYDNKEIIELLGIFVATTNQILVLKSLREVEVLRPEIQEIYIVLWELMASYNLFYSLTQEYKRYTAEFAKHYFKPRFDTLLQIAKELIAHLDEHCKTAFVVEDKYKLLYDAKGSVAHDEYSADDRKKAFDEFEKEESSDIFRAFNINN